MKGRDIPWPILRHWWLCGRKRPYVTRTIAELANEAAIAALRGSGERLTAYECPVSRAENHPHWHLGHAKNTRNSSHRRPGRDAARAWDRFVDIVPRRPWA